MARIVPDSVFRRGYRPTAYKRSPGQRTADQWSSPEGVTAAWKLTDSIGGVINAAVQEKRGKQKILNEIDVTGKNIQLGRAALAAEKGDLASVQKLQKLLSSEGYELHKSTLTGGKFDGLMGPETSDAFDSYRARQAKRLNLTEAQIAQYGTLQERAGGPLDRLISGAGNLVGHDASELEYARQQAALSRAKSIEEAALDPRSARAGYELASGAETMLQREDATDLSMNAYNRMRAATLSGQASGAGQAAIGQNLKRLFPGRKPQRAIRRVSGGPATPRVKEPKTLFNAMNNSTSSTYMNIARGLKANPKDSNFAVKLTSTEVNGTEYPEGTMAVPATKEQIAEMKKGNAASRAEILEQRITAYQQSLAISQHRNYDTLNALMERGRTNITRAVQSSTYTNINDENFRGQVSDPFVALFATRAVGDILDRLDDPAFLASMEYPTYPARAGGRAAKAAKAVKKPPVVKGPSDSEVKKAEGGSDLARALKKIADARVEAVELEAAAAAADEEAAVVEEAAVEEAVIEDQVPPKPRRVIEIDKEWLKQFGKLSRRERQILSSKAERFERKHDKKMSKKEGKKILKRIRQPLILE